MFGLAAAEAAWSPKFRSLISYFVRREASGGFRRPQQQSTDQQLVDQHVHVHYLLGLEWQTVREWEGVRQREKSIKALRKGLKDGAFGQVIDKASKLRSRLVVSRDRARRLREQLSAFRVVEEYHDLEKEAADLTLQLGALADENTTDRRYIAELQRAGEDEVAPAPEDLQRLYEAAGITLPDLVKKRFEDARSFHESVVSNRRAYLSEEIRAAEERIGTRDRTQRELDARRSDIMAILRTSGALEQFTALQAEVTRLEAEAEALQQMYSTAEAVESGSAKLTLERTALQERLRQEYEEQSALVDEAILTFQSVSAALYGNVGAGALTLEASPKGPEIDIHIQGSSSKGVNNMQIFCFDMMLTLLSLKRGRSPGFLIHDSHLFDGVDERQVGEALALGKRLAEEHGFQYIVTLNTDDLPRDVPGFSLLDFAIEPRLTDATDDGGLFGFRFD